MLNKPSATPTQPTAAHSRSRRCERSNKLSGHKSNCVKLNAELPAQGATKIISTTFFPLAGIVDFSIYFISLGGTATNFYSSSSAKSISFQLLFFIFFFFEMFSKLLVIPNPRHRPRPRPRPHSPLFAHRQFSALP